MGLVLTFVTSWVAYQSVVWNLAIGAPDEVAGILVGTKDSATMMFAQQLDVFFDAISSAAASISPVQAANASLASPSNLLSLAALILLLGTVGVLVVCRLALAALLILGPIFIVMALFDNTRGLFEGWLKSVAMFALVPLLTVVIGSGALMAIAPMVAELGSGGSEISLRAAVSVLVASIIYLSLMLVVFKVAATLTRSWRLARSTAPSSSGGPGAYADARAPAISAAATPIAAAPAFSSDRVRTAIASLPALGSDPRIAAARIAPALIPAPVGVSHTVALQPEAARHSQFYSHRTQGASSIIPREILK
jgi:type IV secretion system protein VirB6